MLKISISPKTISQDVIFPSDDLYSDEPLLETYLHLQQMMLLIKCLDWWWRDRNDFFATGNLTISYSLRQRKFEPPIIIWFDLGAKKLAAKLREFKINPDYL